MNYLIINSTKQQKNKEKKSVFCEPFVNTTSSFDNGISPQNLIFISAKFQSYAHNADSAQISNF